MHESEEDGAPWSLGVLLFLVAGVACSLSCGGGSNSSMPPATTTGQVTTILTDPPTCAAPGGTFTNVWVTVTKIAANIGANAGTSDSGWQTLVDLTSDPKQVDLFSLASPTCVLTQLGSTTGLPPGNYQQIRVYLLSNSPSQGTPTPSTNNCSSVGAYNCVVTNTGTFALQLSSEAQTGIKIPPGQISGGAINLQAGQAADISIDFNACASILQEGNGSFRLKPTLNAGVVSQTNNAISGTVVGLGTTTGIGGAIVLLEQPDTTVTPNIDRVQAAAIADSGGNFIFCPLPGQGLYDVVVAGVTGDQSTQVAYNPTIAFRVPNGTSLGNIPLAPEGVAPSPPAIISGQVTTAIDSSTATTGVVKLSAFQDAAPSGGNVLHVTIPVFAAMSQPPAVLTTDTPTPSTPPCPANTDCYNFSLLLPASNALVATYDSSAKSITFPSSVPTSAVDYNVEAWDADCTTANASTATPVEVSPGNTTTLSNGLALSGCPASM
jgi:Domain of unknown function (DUF4382)